ncbi:hypothetical protein [Actinacidiphila soli]|uniref:hypothetical protein n=1 Tax=Actinacidiphila soli TaxID=2487275 RepID=UPI0013E2C8EB|nr:hypothetical protein [Actinacidiphila soli]
MTNRTVLGIDAGSAGLREADHLIHHLVDQLGLPAGTVACTHHIRTGRPHTAVSLTLPDADSVDAVWRALTAPAAEPMGVCLAGRAHGPAHLADAAGQAAAEATARSGGRAVLYPGVGRLTGTVTVADILAHTPIARLTVLGSAPGDHPAPTVEVLTRAHVRPEWRTGDLVLSLVPAVGGRLAPFEVPNPTPCCADH